jgi:hypothetical protein
MSCGRPDEAQDYKKWMGCNSGWKNPAFFAMACNSLRDRALSGAAETTDCTDSEDTQCGSWRVTKRRYSEANYVPNGWPTNFRCGGGDSIGLCVMNDPREENKLPCCKGEKNTTVQCGKNWCETSPACEDYMNRYCSGDKLVDDPYCFKKYKTKKTTEIGQICARQDKFRTPSCKEFCNSQYNGGTPEFSYCASAAGTFCASNPNDPSCKCLTYNKTDEYNKIQSQMPNGQVLGAFQCWGSGCAARASPTWSDTLTTETAGGCNGTYQFCGQSLTTGSIKAGGSTLITQTCNLNASQGTKVVANAPTAAPVASQNAAAGNAPFKPLTPTPTPTPTPAPVTPSAPTPGKPATPAPASSSKYGLEDQLIKGVKNLYLYGGMFMVFLILMIVLFLSTRSG